MYCSVHRNVDFENSKIEIELRKAFCAGV